MGGRRDGTPRYSSALCSGQWPTRAAPRRSSTAPRPPRPAATSGRRQRHGALAAWMPAITSSASGSSANRATATHAAGVRRRRATTKAISRVCEFGPGEVGRSNTVACRLRQARPPAARHRQSTVEVAPVRHSDRQQGGPRCHCRPPMPPALTIRCRAGSRSAPYAARSR